VSTLTQEEIERLQTVGFATHRLCHLCQRKWALCHLCHRAGGGLADEALKIVARGVDEEDHITGLLCPIPAVSWPSEASFSRVQARLASPDLCAAKLIRLCIQVGSTAYKIALPEFDRRAFMSWVLGATPSPASLAPSFPNNPFLIGEGLSGDLFCCAQLWNSPRRSFLNWRILVLKIGLMPIEHKKSTQMPGDDPVVVASLQNRLLDLGYPFPRSLDGKSRAWLEMEIRALTKPRKKNRPASAW
jgi:hypothetical protein